MEHSFHDGLYNPQPNISVADLRNTKQSANESIAKFFE